MRVNLNGDVAIAFEMQVRVMTFALRDAGNVIEEVQSSHEILHDPRLANAFMVMSQFPAGELLDLLFGFRRSELGNAPFARGALLRAEFRGSLNGDGHLQSPVD